MSLFDSLCRKLEKDKNRYEALQGHFVRCRAGAMRLATDSASPIKWIAVEEIEQALLLKFLGRHIRVSMHYDRSGAKGVLYVEDLSAVGRPPMTIGRIPFDYSGETDRPGGYTGGTLSLDQSADQLALALLIVDVALDNYPWIEAPKA